MLNSGDNVHGGCSMFLIDVCVPSVDLSSASGSLARPRHRLASLTPPQMLVHHPLRPRHRDRQEDTPRVTGDHRRVPRARKAVRRPRVASNGTAHALTYRGAKLRIINTTVAFGARTVTARTEVRLAFSRSLRSALTAPV